MPASAIAGASKAWLWTDVVAPRADRRVDAAEGRSRPPRCAPRTGRVSPVQRGFEVAVIDARIDHLDARDTRARRGVEVTSWPRSTSPRASSATNACEPPTLRLAYRC